MSFKEGTKSVVNATTNRARQIRNSGEKKNFLDICREVIGIIKAKVKE